MADRPRSKKPLIRKILLYLAGAAATCVVLAVDLKTPGRFFATLVSDQHGGIPGLRWGMTDADIHTRCRPEESGKQGLSPGDLERIYERAGFRWTRYRCPQQDWMGYPMAVTAITIDGRLYTIDLKSDRISSHRKVRKGRPTENRLAKIIGLLEKTYTSPKTGKAGQIRPGNEYHGENRENRISVKFHPVTHTHGSGITATRMGARVRFYEPDRYGRYGDLDNLKVKINHAYREHMVRGGGPD